MKKLLLSLIITAILVSNTYCQTEINTKKKSSENAPKNYKYSVTTTYLSLVNFDEEKTNTHHYELHFGYQLSPRDKISIKAATWKLFAPMGMPMSEQLKFDEKNFYPGRLRETGIGITYQRMLWKKLFATIEILPQLETYLDEKNKKIASGFKLYTSYHLGYHVPLFNDRFYVEPQVHCQYWPVNTNVPQTFKTKDDEWNNYFLFEPNLYLGVNFEF